MPFGQLSALSQKTLFFASFACANLCGSPFSVTLVLEQSLVLLEFLFNYVSKSCKVLDTFAFFNTIVTLFLFEKTFIFSYLLLLRYSVFKHHRNSLCEFLFFKHLVMFEK